jgi:hypothetical protein
MEDNTPAVTPEVTTEEPVEPQDVAPEPDVTDEPDVTPEGGDEPAAEEPSAEELVADNAAVEGEDPVDEFVPEVIEPPKATPPNINQFVDAEGNLDLAAYNQAQTEFLQNFSNQILSTATRMSDMRSKYEKTWDDAYQTYPQLRSDKELRDMVQAIHANSTTSGKYLSPKAAAARLFGVRNAAKAEGAKQSKETRTVQAAAALATPNAPAATSATNKLTQLKEKMRSGKTVAERKSASADYLAELVRTGKL